jgi:hypothetical protein
LPPVVPDRIDEEGKLMALPTGIRRLALAAAGAPLAAAATVLMLAGPSAAAPQPVKAAAVLHAPSGHVYHTLAKGLRVRRAPSTSATVVARLGRKGSKVTVNCYVHGTSVFGDHIWYFIVAPRTGFVAGFYLNTGRDPARGVPACAVHPRHVYRTLTAGLRVRTAPNLSAKVVVRLGAKGTRVRVSCWSGGTSVFGDHIWYRISAPARGFVAGFYLNTGPDPAPGIARC